MEKAILLQNYDVFIEEYEGEITDLTLATFLACQELNLPIWYKPLTFSVRDVYGTALDTMSIYETTNYSIFGLSPDKSISRVKLNRMKKLISTQNLLLDHPIIVTDRAEYTVLDGAYRFAAAMDLGLPLYFKLTDFRLADRVEDAKELQRRLKNQDKISTDFLRGSLSAN